jgi:hypothetical protein
LIGFTQINDPAPVVTDDQGRLYIFLLDPSEARSSPHLIAMDRSLNPLWEIHLDTELIRPTRYQMVWDGSALRLLWVENSQLYAASVDLEGRVTSSPQKISGEAAVERFTVGKLGTGKLTIWYAGSRRAPGLFALTDGQTEAVLIDPLGTWPSLAVDPQGNLQAAWANIPVGYGDLQVFYANYPAGHISPNQQAEVYRQVLNPGNLFDGPVLGLDTTTTYIFWTYQIKTGMSSGTTQTFYLHFPSGEVEQASQPETIYVPDEYRLSYQLAPEGQIPAGLRVALNGRYSATSALTELAPNPHLASELALGFHSQVDYQWRQRKGQVSLVFLRQGKPEEYQLLSFSNLSTFSPALNSDSDQNLYLTWLEKGSQPGFMVYFASSAPDLRQALSQLDREDLGRLAMETVFGMLFGVVLSPLFGALWLAPMLLTLLITSPLRRRSDDPHLGFGTALSLGLSLAAFWVIKLASLAGFSTYVPFSAWIPIIPVGLAGPLQIVIPVLIGLIAVLVAWHFTYGRQMKNALYFLLIYAGVDALLTMSIYGVLVYDAF